MLVKINAKCSDLFSCIIESSKGKELLNYDGYVPDFMPNQHYGDYVELTIDAKTGKIVDWPKDATELIKAFIKEEKNKQQTKEY